MKHYRLFLLLIGLLVLAFLADIAIGSVSLSIRDVWNTFIGSNDNLIYREIILNHRLPKALTAILAGASLSVAGVLMYFVPQPTGWSRCVGSNFRCQLRSSLTDSRHLFSSVVAHYRLGTSDCCYYWSYRGFIIGYYCLYQNSSNHLVTDYRYDVW